MPVLNKTVIQNFRNIALQELEFSPNMNCITGGNGEGKTNLLDAIWYLSMTKSAFAASDSYNFRHGCDSFAISGAYSIPGDRTTRISVQVDKGGEKKFKRDDKQYQKISEHIGLLPIVMVSPEDTSMVSESGDERRRFINSVLSQMDCKYLFSLQQYNKLLLQRNKLLKDGCRDSELFDVIESRMESSANPIFETRQTFISELLPTVARYYETISGGKETIGITLRSQLFDGPLADMLKEHREKDIILKYTGTGIQRDDLNFEMDGYPIRKCGSQGQQKSFLVALKFAQYDLMRKHYGYSPILLLDDLFDKLDMKRVENLLAMVSGNDFGQIFISDANKERTRSVVDSLTSERMFYVADGGVFRNE